MKTILILLFLLSLHVFSFEGNEKGQEIANRVHLASQGYIGEESLTNMILIDAYGSKVVREIEGKSIEGKNSDDKALSIFKTPKDVKGTKFLTWSHKNKSDDQWLYLPSLRRVKRISSRNKSSSYMGSEFTYEDLSSQDPIKFIYRFVKEVTDKRYGKSWVLERKKKDKTSYSKERLYISQKYMNAYKTEFYDQRGELLKIGQASDFKEFNVNGKKIFRTMKFDMHNQKNNKRSIIEWKKRNLGKKFSLKTFRKESLK